jgi:hypothetical protein
MRLALEAGKMPFSSEKSKPQTPKFNPMKMIGKYE